MGFARPTNCETAGTKDLENGMSRSARIAVAAALLLGGTSLAMAKIRGAPRTAIVPHPGINETTSRQTVADPYYRLSDPCRVGGGAQ